MGTLTFTNERPDKGGEIFLFRVSIAILVILSPKLLEKNDLGECLKIIRHDTREIEEEVLFAAIDGTVFDVEYYNACVKQAGAMV
tara:strand:+ start:1028 stop:1282 length:255 start_codon:yes stop_codon:yes gene_type:complete